MNDSRLIIAICGLKRSGKDVLADYLVAKYNYEKEKIADPLKKVLKTLFNFTDDQLETNLKENIDPYWNISPREIMQFFGTEMMQYKIQEILPNIGKKFWINSLISRIQNNRKYVVSDLRFIHEHEELKKKNVFVIKITRPDNNNVNIDHISEQEYLNIPYDVHIVNNGTIDELLIKLDNALTIK